MRKYPVGIQSFDKIRNEGYVYVDKTPLIYKMITEGCPYFLSRPRRFGKSLLLSTLAAVFEGRRELFEAFTTEQGIEQPQLFIATTNWKWEKYPVLRFDFSSGDLATIKDLDSLIDFMLSEYEEQYGIKPRRKSDFNLRMKKLIHTAERETVPTSLRSAEERGRPHPVRLHHRHIEVLSDGLTYSNSYSRLDFLEAEQP